MQKLLLCFCLALVVTPVNRFALDGENSEFTCNLYSGNVDNSFKTMVNNISKSDNC